MSIVYFLWEYISHGGVVYIFWEYIFCGGVVYIFMGVYLMEAKCIFSCEYNFMWIYGWRRTLWEYIFYGGVAYIAIPGATERSVQYLITRVWGA